MAEGAKAWERLGAVQRELLEYNLGQPLDLQISGPMLQTALKRANLRLHPELRPYEDIRKDAQIRALELRKAYDQK